TGVFTSSHSGITANIVGNDLITDGNGKSSSPVSLLNQNVPGTTAEASDSSAGVNTSYLAKDSSNIVELNPTTSDIVGKNLMVTLQGYNIPMMFTFDAGAG